MISQGQTASLVRSPWQGVEFSTIPQNTPGGERAAFGKNTVQPLFPFVYGEKEVAGQAAAHRKWEQRAMLPSIPHGFVS